MSLNGVINLYKPPGMTSAQAVAAVKRIFGAKTGHAGTLDPAAAGVLPILVGQGTRVNDYVMAQQKQYLAEIAFGYATDTQDAQGHVIQQGSNYPDRDSLLLVLRGFVGQQQQVPPQYSALKVQGKPAYDLARAGLVADLKARLVEIVQLDLLHQTDRNGWLFRVVCSKGTYIRTLCHDIGQALTCPAHLRFLLRERTGSFCLEQSITLEELQEKREGTDLTDQSWFYNIKDALSDLPMYTLRQPVSSAIKSGVNVYSNQVLETPPVKQTEVCLLNASQVLGIYTWTGEVFQPVKLFTQ